MKILSTDTIEMHDHAGVVQLQMHLCNDYGRLAYLVSYPSEIKGYQREKIFYEIERAHNFIDNLQ